MTRDDGDVEPEVVGDRQRRTGEHPAITTSDERRGTCVGGGVGVIGAFGVHALIMRSGPRAPNREDPRKVPQPSVWSRRRHPGVPG